MSSVTKFPLGISLQHPIFSVRSMCACFVCFVCMCLYPIVNGLYVCVCVLRSHHSKYSGVCGAIIFVFLVVMRVVVDYKRINSIWFVVLFTHTVNRSVLGIPLNSRKKETQPRIHTWSESVSTFARVTNTTNGARGGKCFCWCVGGTFFLFSNFRCFFLLFRFRLYSHKSFGVRRRWKR